MFASTFHPFPFFDRTAESGLVDACVALLGRESARLTVLEVSGPGGVGKSRFLERTRARLGTEANRLTLVSVNLEQEGAKTAADPLLDFRNQLPFDCPLFDTALLGYWAGMDRQPLPLGGRYGSRAASIAELTSGESGTSFLPADLGERVFSQLSVDEVRRLGYLRDDFSRVDRLRSRPDELLIALPEHLGRDIARRRGNPLASRLVACYDGYDRQSSATLAEHVPWLRRLLTSIGDGVHIVAARDGLGWARTELAGRIQRVPLGPLPESESRRMIRRALGDLDRQVENAIIDRSGSIAFNVYALLDKCWDELRRNGTINVKFVKAGPAAVPEDFLDHLGEAERVRARMLATVQYFDDALYRRLLQAAGIGADLLDVQEFAEWFFVTGLPTEGLFRTHDLLTETVRGAAGHDPRVSDTLRIATAHLLDNPAARLAPGAAERRPQLFRALVEGWQNVDDMTVADVEHLIDIGYELYDAGEWRGLQQLPGLSSKRDHPVALTAKYFAALVTRRTVGPTRALQMLAPLEPMRERLDRHAKSFDIERAYLRELQGEYAHARTEFRRLSEAIRTFDAGRRDHLRARLYHGDMLIMDGHLAEANELLARTYGKLDEAASLDRAELMRHRGHAYRFSLEFEAAELRYAEALVEARESPSMTAKLRTNLAESRCWHTPAALGDARLAIELNRRLGSRIEEAKAQAAHGVALARAGSFAEAESACRNALGIADDADYPAARCFAWQAMVALAVWDNRPDDADEAYGQLVAGIERLGTYPHLAVVPAWLRRDEAEFNRYAARIDWISPMSPQAGLDQIESR